MYMVQNNLISPRFAHTLLSVNTERVIVLCPVLTYLEKPP